jgi:hypothetical protein
MSRGEEKQTKRSPLMPRFGVRSLLLLVTAFCVYLGAYLASLRPVVVVDEGSHGMLISGSQELDYLVPGKLWRITFAPAAWIDYQLRPQYWNEYSDYD